MQESEIWTAAEMRAIQEAVVDSSAFLDRGDIAGLRCFLRSVMYEHGDRFWGVFYFLCRAYRLGPRWVWGVLKQLFEEFEEEWDSSGGAPQLFGPSAPRPDEEQLRLDL